MSEERRGWTADPAWQFGVRPMVRGNPCGRLALPTPEQLTEMGAGRAQAYLEERERLLGLSLSDPLFHGWEPPVWTLCDCLCGFPWVDARLAAEVRAALGFRKVVQALLINGANGGGKSWYAARTSNLVLWRSGVPADVPPRQNDVYAFHETMNRSNEDQQPMIAYYLPQPYRAMVRRKGGYKAGGVAHMEFTEHGGFQGEHIITPAADRLTFSYYSSENSKQGFKPKFIWCEELVDSDTAFTLKARVSDKQGNIIFTFTPVDGYTDTVRLFHANATVQMTSPGFFLPEDGGEADVDAAMYVEDVVWRIREKNLTTEDTEGTERKEQERAEDGGRRTARRDGFMMPAGRKFCNVPRVMKCQNDNDAIVFFHGADNPFGNPRNMWETRKTVSTDRKKILLYGWAERAQTNVFVKYSEAVHVIPDAQADAMKGTDYFLMDPAGSRNFFWLWVRVARESWCVLNEWPGNYEVEGVGFPGYWAENDPKKPDGRRGEAQKDYGWGLERVKEEIARLELWPDYLAAMAEVDPAKRKPARDWDDPANRKQRKDGGRRTEDREQKREGVLATFRPAVEERFMDSRPASEPMKVNDRPVTLLSEFDDMGMFFRPTPGMSKDEGLRLINRDLDYDTARPVDFRNRPRGFVAERCINTRYALRNYTGKKADGMTSDERSACGEPVDLLRYFVLLGLGTAGTGTVRDGGGGGCSF